MIRPERVGAEVVEELQEGDVGRHRGQEGWRRAGPIEDATPRGTAGEPGVRVGAALDEAAGELEAGHRAGADRRRVARVVVAAVGLADPGQGVQRREARPLVVRVGPGVEQGGGQVEVAVLDRQDQRRGPPARPLGGRFLGLHRRIDVGPRPDQGERRVDSALADGEEQRREARGERGPEVGPGLEQLLDHGGVPLGRGPHQGGLAAAFAGVGVGLAGEQRSDRPGDARPRRDHQRGLAAREPRGGVGPGDEEEVDQRARAVRAGQRQGEDPVPVHRADLGPGIDEEPGRVEVVPPGGPVEGGHPVDLRLVRVVPPVEPGANPGPVAPLGEVGDRRFARRRRRSEQGEGQVGRGQGASHGGRSPR